MKYYCLQSPPFLQCQLPLLLRKHCTNIRQAECADQCLKKVMAGFPYLMENHQWLAHLNKEKIGSAWQVVDGALHLDPHQKMAVILSPAKSLAILI